MFPEPEWVDFGDDIEKFGREAREAWQRMHTSRFTPGITPHYQEWSWAAGPANVVAHSPQVPSGTFDGGHLPESVTDPLVIPQIVNDPPIIPRTVPPGPTEFYANVFGDPGPYSFNVNGPPNPYPWEFPPTPRLRTIPLPPVGPHYDEGGSFDGDRGNGGSGEGDDNPSEEHNTTRVTEGLISLGTAKSTNRENNSQHQQPSSAALPRRGGYNRTENNQGKKQCFVQLREVLGIPSKEGELLTLKRVIEHLGGTVPQPPASSGWLLKGERQAKKLEERHRCFEVLKNLVCPWMTQVRELEILRNVLARVTSTNKPQGLEGPGTPVHITQSDRTFDGTFDDWYGGLGMMDQGRPSGEGPSSYTGD